MLVVKIVGLVLFLTVHLTSIIRHNCGIATNSLVESSFAIPSRRLPFGKGIPLGYCLALPLECHYGKVKPQQDDLQVNYTCGVKSLPPGTLPDDR